jgi:ABC-type glycerol-3-phosphate transport system permease component
MSISKIQNATLQHKRVALRKILKSGSSHIFLMITAVVIGLPFFWMITTAFKSSTEVYQFPPIWLPETFHWDNFITAWQSAPFGRFYINSIITTVAGVALEVLIATLTAYAFARIEFPHRDALFVVVLAAMMIPGQLALIPNYVTLHHLGWINTLQGIVVPHISSVFGAFLLRQAFLSLSQEIFDAAKIDGASHLRSLFSIAIPIVKPVIATLVLYLFIAKWNAYLWPLIVTNSQNMRTLPVGLVMVRHAEYQIGPEHLMAASLFVLLPVLIVFFAAQKQLIEGIAAGAVKQ